MNSVSIRQARRQLSEIVDAAQRGKSIVITRRGRSAARVTSVQAGPGRRLPDLTDFRRSIKVRGQALSKAVVESRRRERP